MDPPASTSATPAPSAPKPNAPPPAHDQAKAAKAPNASLPVPARSYPGLTSAEKSLFPNSMPVRQTLPSIHSFSPATTSQQPQSPYPPPSRHSQPPSATTSEHKQQNRYSSSASPYGAASLPPISAPANTSPVNTTPTPPIIPPAASPKVTSSASTPAHGPKSAGSPPLSRPSLPGINHISPRLAAAAPPPSSNPAPSQQAQQQQGRDASSPYGTSGGARRNPMSVSSMLSGPPRASGIAAFTPSSAGPPQPPVLPPIASAPIDTNAKGATPASAGSPPLSGPPEDATPARSPILSRPTASGSNLPSFRPPSTHELKPGSTSGSKVPSPALEKKDISTAGSTATSASGQSAKPAYPSLPSAFARENPYSTAPPSGSSTPSAPSANQTPSSHHSSTAKPAPAQPFFPNLAGYRPPPFPSNPPNANNTNNGNRQLPYGSPAGSATPSSAANSSQQHSSQPPPSSQGAYPWQQQAYGNPQHGQQAPPTQQGSPKLEHTHPHPPHSHSHHSHSHSSHPHAHSAHSHSHTHASAANPASHSSHAHSHPVAHSHSHPHAHSHSNHARRPSGASSSIAQSPQASRNPAGGAAKPSPAAATPGPVNGGSNKVPAAGGGGAGARFSSLMDGPYGQSIRENGPGVVNKPSPVGSSVSTPPSYNGTPHHHHHHAAQAHAQPPQKRRRSETQPSIAPNVQAATTTKVARASPSIPSTPAPLPPPPFTNQDLRLATIRPPLVSIDNSAVEACVSDLAGQFEKRGQPRPFAGRKLYDPYTNPAQLLDGATLRACVGGTVELVIPTSLLVDPPTSSSNGLMTTTPIVRSRCSVPPVARPPIAISYGPPQRYDGKPLAFTSNTTQLSLPPHLFDLPSFRTRQVWGTDVYTDDSDVLAVVLHSGWVRLARRERVPRAGEKGAGDDAIRRAREKISVPNPKRKKVSRVVNEVAQHPEPDTSDARSAEGNKDKNGAATDGEDHDDAPPPENLVVTLGIVPALVRYQGLERGGIRSRSWGNGHDGVSLRVEAIKPLDCPAVEHGRKTLNTHASITSRQLSSDRNSNLHSYLPPSPVYEDDVTPRRSNRSEPKRFKFSRDATPTAGAQPSSSRGDDESASSSSQSLQVSDTFVLDFKTGTGEFVGLVRESAPRRVGDADGMEIEA